VTAPFSTVEQALEDVRAGRIPRARVEDAARSVLRLKAHLAR
jgi:hypothetical protein